MATAHILVRYGSKERQMPLEPNQTFRIGRSASSTVALDSPAVSRHHASIQPADHGSFVLTDLGSRNGTILNGRRVMVPTRLRHDDRIQIGDYTLIFVDELDPASGGPSSTDVGETLVTLKTRTTSVLVMDIRGYTALSKRVGEVRIAKIMSSFNREAGAVLERLGSWGQKYLGDATMSFWIHQEHQQPIQVLLAILEGLTHCAAIAASLQGRFALEDPLRLGFGAAAGVASVGNMGDRITADHTALGDVVNRAFRLESATRPLGCDLVLGEEIVTVLASYADITPVTKVHSVMLKGYHQPTKVWTFHLHDISGVIAEIRRRGVILGHMDRAQVDLRAETNPF